MSGEPKRKRGRPRSKQLPAPPGDRISPRMKTAIGLMVEEGASIKDAALAAGLTYQAIYLALKRANVREFFFESLKPLRIVARAEALHALRKEMLTSDNAASRVAAARTLLSEDDSAGRLGSGTVHSTPNFIIMVGGTPPSPVTIEHQPNEQKYIGADSILRDRPELDEPEPEARLPLRWDSQRGEMVNGRPEADATAVRPADQYGRRR